MVTYIIIKDAILSFRALHQFKSLLYQYRIIAEGSLSIIWLVETRYESIRTPHKVRWLVLPNLASIARSKQSISYITSSCMGGRKISLIYI